MEGILTCLVWYFVVDRVFDHLCMFLVSQQFVHTQLQMTIWLTAAYESLTLTAYNVKQDELCWAHLFAEFLQKFATGRQNPAISCCF